MRFDRFGHKDDALFVIAIVLTALVTGARFLGSEREMNQIAQAQQPRTQATMVASGHRPDDGLRIAYDKGEAR